MAARNPMRFERSLRIDDARDSDVLLAYAMNGEPLPVEHGYPLRLIVPALVRGRVGQVAHRDRAHRPDVHRALPGRQVLVRMGAGRPHRSASRSRCSGYARLITEPTPQTEVRPGDLAIRGVAWSGAAPIARVEVSVNGGDWQEARLVSERNRHSWQWWELITRVEQTGPSPCAPGRPIWRVASQPERAEWNRLGYGNNAIQQVPIRVS